MEFITNTHSNDNICIHDTEVNIHTKTLKLCDKGLKSFPEQIFQLTQLEELDLSCNDIVKIPPGISLLKNLTKLSLWNNCIEIIPPEIFQMTQLVSLVLNDNFITNIPRDIGLLKDLECVSLSTNYIKTVPDVLFEIPTINRLYLHNNRIKFIPHNASGIHQLSICSLFDNNLVYNLVDTPTNNNAEDIAKIMHIIQKVFLCIARLKIQVFLSKYMLPKFYDFDTIYIEI